MSKKSILIFSDGTGQYGGVRADQRLSNIYKMYRAMRPGPFGSICPAHQVAFYDPGLGSGELAGRVRNILAGAFGTGISQNVVDCYEAILRHYLPGDRVFLFGFSRGAYTARCVANVMNLYGVPSQSADGTPLPPGGLRLRKIAEKAVYRVYEHGSGHSRREYEVQREELARRFRGKYACAGCGAGGEAQGNVAPEFIGVFDTVAALGGVVLRRILRVITSIAAALAFFAWWRGWSTPWMIASLVPAVFLLGSLAWATKKQFKYIKDPPGGGRFAWHFAAWRLKNYDRFLDSSAGYARHAQSIDENRRRFPRVGWGRSGDVQGQDRHGIAWLRQVWFAGNHSDIGGSYPEEESRLSDIPLQWMLDELAKIPSSPLIADGLVQTFPDALGRQHDEVASTLEMWPRWWPKLLRVTWDCETRDIDPKAILDPSVKARFAAPAVPNFDEMKPYRPDGLSGHSEVGSYY